MANYSSKVFKDLLKNKLIRDNSDLNSDTIDSVRTLLFENEWSEEDLYNNVWNDFLSFLKSETESNSEEDPTLDPTLNNNGLPITNNLWTTTYRSLFEYINEKIDLSDNLYGQLRQILNNNFNGIDSETGECNTTTNTFWNESVSNLIGYYLRNLTPRGIDSDNENNGKIVSWTNNDEHYQVNLKQVRNGDAGKDFSKDYVSPLENVKEEKYKDVRGKDFIVSDAQNSENLKYTNPKDVSNAIRLLMPDYQRQVKVEDLNRNFWVISQCIAGICAYLFEGESPINNIIERTLNEIVQLWENLLYLWAIFAISVANKRKQYTDVHCEIVPLSISKDYNFRKYDNFDDYEGIYDNENKVDLGALENLILANIKYLEDTYPESNLCIVPFMRMGNYEHNYYNEEWYPGVAIFDRNKKEQGGGWTFNYFKTTYAPSIKTVSSGRYGLKLSTNYASPINDDTLVIYNFLLNSWGITKSKNGVMKAHYPAYTISEYEEWDNDTYYAVSRCLPSNFTAQYIEKEVNGQQTKEVEFGGITFKLEDGIGQGLKSWAKDMGEEEYASHSSEERRIIDDLKGSSQKIFNISIRFNSQYEEDILSGSRGMYVNPDPERIEYEKNLTKITPFGYYMGELMSDTKESKQFYPTLSSHSIYGRPLTTDIGKIKQDNDDSSRYTSKNLFSSDSIFQELKESDYEVLQNYINNKLNSTSNNLELYNLTHQYGIKASESILKIEPYYIYENNELKKIDVKGDDYNPKQVIKSSDPIFSFNSSTRKFDKKNAGNASNELMYQTGSDIRASSGGYYGSRRGTFSVCSVLWVPFVQGFYYLRNFLQYDRINMCPDVQHEPIYHETNNNVDTNIVQIEEYKKNEAYYPLRDLLHVIKKFELNTNYSEKALYYADSYTVTELVLFDKTGKVSEDNWGIKYTTATYNYNCILDTPGINSQTGEETFKTYYKFINSTVQGVQDLLGFHPLKINSQNYKDLKNQKKHDAYLLFNMIKKDVTNCYYENPDNLYEAPFYQIFFKKDGKIDPDLSLVYQKEFMSEFNIWIMLAEAAETPDTKISLTTLTGIAGSAARAGLNCTLRDYLSSVVKDNKTFEEIYNMSDGTYIVPNNYEHGSCWKTFIGHSYVSSISTILVFPNGQQVVKRINTQDPDGHNAEYSSNFDDIVAYDGLNTSLDLTDYLPGFYYDSTKSATINWHNLYNEWLLRSNLLYSQTSDNAAKYTIDSSNKKLLSAFLKEKNLKALNFTKYPNNGRRTI